MSSRTEAPDNDVLSCSPSRRLPCALHSLAPGLIVGLVTALSYSLVSLSLFRNLHSGMDLAIFDQAVRALSRFQAPVAPMKAVGMNLWGDHFHPILIAATPGYWIWDDPRSLLITQAVAIGLTCAILTWAAQHIWRLPVLMSSVLGASLAAALGVQYGAVFDFHEVALGMPILAAALACIGARRWRSAVVMSVLLLTVKEDASLLVVGVALLLWLRGQRRRGALLAAVALVWTTVAIKLIIPALNPHHVWPYAGALGSPMTSLRSLYAAFVTDGGLSTALVLMLLATGSLALRSPLIVVIIPNVLSRAVGNNPEYWRIFNHYNLLPCTALAFAAVDVLSSLRRTRTTAIALIALIAIGSILSGPAWSQSSQNTDPARLAALQRTIDRIPAGASVAADAYLTPHLTHRHPVTQQVRLAGHGNLYDYTDDLGQPLHDEYLLLDLATTSNGGDPRWVPVAEQHFINNGYQLVSNDGDFLLLHRSR